MMIQSQRKLALAATLLCVFSVALGQSVFSLRADYTLEELRAGTANILATDGWQILIDDGSGNLRCNEETQPEWYVLCFCLSFSRQCNLFFNYSFRTLFECDGDCQRFTNRDVRGFNSTASPVTEDPDNLFYFNRIPLYCQSKCGSNPPNPPEVFYCDQATSTWVLNCSSSAQCTVNGTITIDGTTTVVIDRPTIIRGGLLGSGNSTIRISILPGSTTNLTVDQCVDLPNPIEISLVSSSNYKNTTVLEFLNCGGQTKPPLFSSTTSWDDCATGYTRKIDTITSGNKVTVALLFIPVDSSKCPSAPSGGAAVLETGFPTSAAIGIGVGLAVLVIAIAAVVIGLRLRHRNREEKQANAQELYNTQGQ
jgi:hypothetical protein